VVEGDPELSGRAKESRPFQNMDAYLEGAAFFLACPNRVPFLLDQFVMDFTAVEARTTR
jgi:hypothetical protein